MLGEEYNMKLYTKHFLFITLLVFTALLIVAKPAKVFAEEVSTESTSQNDVSTSEESNSEQSTDNTESNSDEQSTSNEETTESVGLDENQEIQEIPENSENFESPEGSGSGNGGDSSENLEEVPDQQEVINETVPSSTPGEEAPQNFATSEIDLTPTVEEQFTENGKVVVISATEEQELVQDYINVPVRTEIPEIYRVGQEDKIQINWQNNGNEEMQFVAYDDDGNGFIDHVAWVVPHLSTQIFEIIFSFIFTYNHFASIVHHIGDV